MIDEKVDQVSGHFQVVPVASGVDAGQGQFAVAGVDHASGLFQNLFAGTTDARAPDFGDDAVGAVLVAAVLDLQRAPSAPVFYRAVDLEETAGAGLYRRVEGNGRRSGQMGLQMLTEICLLSVADDQVGSGILQFVRLALGVAACGHHCRPGVGAAGATHRLARVGVPRPGHRTGVDDVDIRLGPEGNDLVAAAAEAGLERLDLVEIELAADVLQGDFFWRCCGWFGHKKGGNPESF